MMLILAFLAGLIVGAGIVWLIARARIAEGTAALEKDNAILRQALEHQRTQAEEKSAAEIQATRTLQKQNKEEIDALLAPLQEKLKEFQQELRQANKESAEKRGELAAQIKMLAQTSATMTTETTNLAKALKGQSQAQGAWGERILSSIFEKSGLRKDEEYVLQQSHATEDGQKVRPDALVNLPGADGQKIVIDSKVSLLAFSACVNADNDAERTAHLDRHLDSMRAHIKELSGKDYQWAAGSKLDYVIMFVPIEGALAAAVQADPELTGFALENNVVIATPTTLMIVLRTVANIWQVERRNRNAETIAVRAGKIYDKLAGFIGDMTGIGARLDQAKAAYDEAMSKLTLGRGNLASQVEQLKGLGARTNKSLPGNLADEAEATLPPANDDAA